MSGRFAPLVLFGLLLLLPLSSVSHANEDRACGLNVEVAQLKAGGLIENEYVRASLLQLRPGETHDVSEARHRISFAVGAYEIERSFEGGIAAVSADPGDVHRVMSRPHQVRNVGAAEAVLLQVESLITPFRPDPPGPSEYVWSTEHDFSKMAPEQVRLRFSDPQFHVVEVTLAGGETLPRAWQLNRIVLPASRFTARYEAEDGSKKQCERRMDEFVLQSAENKQVTNLGPAEARFTVIGLKPAERYTGYEP